jgi:hypothetical protein
VAKMKKLNPDTIQMVDQEIKNYLKQVDNLQSVEAASDEWYAQVRKIQALYQLLKSTTGLSEYKLDDLIFNKTNTSSYWLPNGDIRKEHP